MISIFKCPWTDKCFCSDMTKSDTLSDFFLTNKGRRKELIGISLKEFFVFGASRINLLLQLSLN